MAAVRNTLVYFAALFVQCASVRLVNPNSAKAVQPVAAASSLVVPVPALVNEVAAASLLALPPTAEATALVSMASSAVPVGPMPQVPVGPMPQTPAQAALTAQAAASAASNAAVAAASAAASANAAAAVASKAAAPVTGTVPIAIPVQQATSSWYIVQAIQFLAGLTFTMIIKVLCVAGNVMVQVSPLPQARAWQAHNSTGESDAAPYVAIFFGGCQWCFYGLFAYLVTSRSGFLVLVQSNILGAVLGSYYVTVFWRNCRNEASQNSVQRYLSAVSALVVLQLCSLSTLPVQRALFVTGLISSFCSFMGATSVLVTVPAVIRSKNSSSIPGAYAAANMASSMVWAVCGFIIEDPMVMMPNIFSTACSATSLALKVVYPSITSASDDKLASVELEESLNDELLYKPLKPTLTEKSKPGDIDALRKYISKPSPFTAMLPEDEQIYQYRTALPEGLEYLKGTGQKLIAAAGPKGRQLAVAIGLPPKAFAWGGDGTGGTC